MESEINSENILDILEKRERKNLTKRKKPLYIDRIGKRQDEFKEIYLEGMI